MVVFILFLSMNECLRAQIVREDEAVTVAKNWIATVIKKFGDWGGRDDASVQSVQEFKRGDRLLGYYVSVNPSGYIVVSLRKEFPPIRAYSTTVDIDPASNAGIVDVTKIFAERILDEVEKKIGPVKNCNLTKCAVTVQNG